MGESIFKKSPRRDRLPVGDRILHYRCPVLVKARFGVACDLSTGQQSGKVLLYLIRRAVRDDSFLPVYRLSEYQCDDAIVMHKVSLPGELYDLFIKRCTRYSITASDAVYTMMLVYISRHFREHF